MAKKRHYVSKKIIVMLLLLFFVLGSFLYVYYFRRELLLWIIVSLKPEKPAVSFSQLQKSHFSNIGEIEKANWVRIFTLWNDIEREKGKYDFSFLDLLVKHFQKDNRVLLITIMPYAKWDQDTCHDEKYLAEFPTPRGKARIKVGKPCDMNAYRSFLRALVERYDGDGKDDMPGLRYPIKHWEIINEPSMQGIGEFDLKFFYGTPEEYLEILKVSYQAIKQADPEAVVLMGGMAGMHKEAVEFWDKIMDEAKNYFDVANIHSISTTGEREDLYLIKFKEFLRRHGVDKPIWITEAQYGELFKPPKDLASVEKLMVRSTVFAFANGAEKIFHIGNWYEFWKSKSTQKVYETLVNKLDYFDSVEIIRQECEETYEGVRVVVGQYKFTIGNRTVYVLWGEAPLPQELQGKLLKVTNIYGESKIMKSTEVKLSDSPIYIEIVGG